MPRKLPPEAPAGASSLAKYSFAPTYVKEPRNKGIAMTVTTSAAHDSIQDFLPAGILPSSSRTIATQIAAGEIADLGPFIAQSDPAPGAHQQIAVDGKTCAIAQSVDAMILACHPVMDAAETPTTLDALIGVLTAEQAPLFVGVEPADVFLGLYAARTGHLPSVDAPFSETAVAQCLTDLARITSAGTYLSAAQAAQSLADTPGGFALLPFGHAMKASDKVITAPLRITPEGAPIAMLEWSGWAMSVEADDEAFEQALAAIAFPTVAEQAVHCAIWLLDGFTPDARHDGLLQTIAAGAALAPTDLWFANLRHDLAPLLHGDGSETVAQDICALTVQP